MTIKNPKVEALLKNPDWNKERKALRTILLECGLTEEVKWRQLCYMHEGSNVALVYNFKDHCATGFMKSSLLKDSKKLLQSPGENSQAMRYLKFGSLEEIEKKTATIKSYVREAMKVEEAGLKVDFKAKKDLKLVDELLTKFKSDPVLKKAFNALTPGRQRGYNLFFSAPKQSATRTSRIEKARTKILEGKGLNDR